MTAKPNQQRLEPEVIARIRAAKILAVVVVDEPGCAVPLVEALQAGGISGIELTLRTPAAFEALRLVRQAYPELLIGMGTLIDKAQVAPAVAGGADFAVAPGCNPALLRSAAEAALPFFPGVATPSDIEAALAEGRTLLKFFPAEPCGGISYLQSVAAPYAHLDLEYIPLGGLDAENFTRYLALENVPAIGGSWIAPRELIRKRDWETITRNALEATGKLVR
jgi:2-dehydro-3-deoxyphosphogluconate aldolase/(4S)-4-hydroxy-2-oxoglutarate aldolase